MKFKTLIKEESQPEYQEQEGFTVDDIIELLPELTYDELQELGEELMEIIYDEEFDLDDMDDIEENINEVKYFDKKKNQVNREKKKDKSQRRKDAKKRKQWYKRNKSKIKRKQKLYRKKAKRQPNLVKHHR